MLRRPRFLSNAKARRSESGYALERVRECERILIADSAGNVFDRRVAGCQQMRCSLDAQISELLHGAATEAGLTWPPEMFAAYACKLGEHRHSPWSRKAGLHLLPHPAMTVFSVRGIGKARDVMFVQINPKCCGSGSPPCTLAEDHSLQDAETSKGEAAGACEQERLRRSGLAEEAEICRRALLRGVMLNGASRSRRGQAGRPERLFADASQNVRCRAMQDRGTIGLRNLR